MKELIPVSIRRGVPAHESSYVKALFLLLGIVGFLSACATDRAPSRPPFPPVMKWSQPPETGRAYKFCGRQDLRDNQAMEARGVTVSHASKGDNVYQVLETHRDQNEIPVLGDLKGKHEFVLDQPGSKDMRIAIHPSWGETLYAGLRFRTPCNIEVRRDCVVIVDREDIVVQHRQSERFWQSRRFESNGEQVIGFFEQP